MVLLQIMVFYNLLIFLGETVQLRHLRQKLRPAQHLHQTPGGGTRGRHVQLRRHDHVAPTAAPAAATAAPGSAPASSHTTAPTATRTTTATPTTTNAADPSDHYSTEPAAKYPPEYTAKFAAEYSASVAAEYAGRTSYVAAKDASVVCIAS